MKTGFFISVLLILLLLPDPEAMAQNREDSLGLSEQIAVWAGSNLNDPSYQQIGFRYIPSLFYQVKFKQSLKFDFDASVNTYCNLRFSDLAYDKFQSKIKPYRISARMSSEQWEIRAGLQKISFGSAVMLRPLMWFDQIDPRDPLQLTDGIYGLLTRYYFLNNANIWFWGLIGNHERRGWDLTPPCSKYPEIGGRIQLPVPAGEMALSLHHRKADFKSFGYLNPDSSQVPEARIGLDGKWDIGPGIWFEYVYKNATSQVKELSYHEHQLNIGSDYTLAVGNGINISAEHLYYSLDALFFTGEKVRNFSAFMLSYPFGMTDRASLMIYYSYESKDWYRFISLQRQYDNLSLYLMLFWNPANFNIYSGSDDINLFSGTGFQFMITFNN